MPTIPCFLTDTRLRKSFAMHPLQQSNMNQDSTEPLDCSFFLGNSSFARNMLHEFLDHELEKLRLSDSPVRVASLQSCFDHAIRKATIEFFSKIKNLRRSCDSIGSHVGSSGAQSRRFLGERLPTDMRSVPSGSGAGGSVIISFRVVIEIMKGRHKSITFEALLDRCDERIMRGVVVTLAQREYSKELAMLVKDSNGFKSLMKLISTIKASPALCNCLMSALSRGIGCVMMQANGSEFIKHCFNELEPGQTLFISEAALDNFDTLATDSTGRDSLIACIGHSRLHNNYLLEKVIDNSFKLANDIHGNHVVQFAIRFNYPLLTECIWHVLREHLVELSQSQTGSFVIEACLTSSVGELVREALAAVSEVSLIDIASSAYGNYVLQTALKGRHKDKLINDNLFRALKRIREHLSFNPNARNILKSVVNIQKEHGLC